ncbi:MAG TPA: protoporphyrinogen oxidase [Candidatus Polarisedimenticolaceae bacterium]|nr:protoporphyrinogen oxidase [Candidatus Polarisedimenticolaceae bacterium]
MAVRVAVVGGGMAGLAAAWHLQQAGASPLVLEATDAVGGLVQTIDLAGRRLELGADTLVTQKPAAVHLCRRLGLGGDLVFHDAAASATRVLLRGRPTAIPAGTNLLAPTRWVPLLRSGILTWRGVLRLALEPRVPAVPAVFDPEHDESLASFVRRRFGREVLDAFAEPVLASLFLGDAERLSMRLALPRLLEAERAHGSVRRALRKAARTGRPHAGSGGFASLRGGLGTLPQRLAAALPRGTVRLNAAVERVSRQGDGFAVMLGSGERVLTDAIVLACPAHRAAAMVSDLDAPLAADLSALEASSCATVHLVFRGQDVEGHVQGHGFFVPRGAGLPLLACSYVSEKYPERARPGDLIVRAFVGGARDPQALEGSDKELVARTQQALAPVLHARAMPVLAHVQRHDRAMPHFQVGDAPRLARIAARTQALGPITLAGGLRGAVGVPDVVASAQAAADELTAVFRQRPGMVLPQAAVE